MLVEWFQDLYDIEDRARDFTPESRRELRQLESKPILERMRAYLASDAVAHVMPKEPFGEAIRYINNQLEHLLVHLDDGLIPIDNNVTEQLMKRIALGRIVFWMFIGRVEAGYRAADLFTLVSSALRCDLDVFVYVKDVLDKLLAGCSEYHLLRPDVWKESHPEAVRVYRQDERRHRAEAKSIKRANRRSGRK